MRKITFGTGCWLRLGLATFSVPVEDGKAVQEECYVQRMMRLKEITPPPKAS